MEPADEIPTLLQLMFGDSARTALHAASPRLLLWCRAFDDWLAERLHSSKSLYNRSLLAWSRLYRRTHGMPWELRPAGIAAHVEWMRSSGFSANTIAGEFSALSLFYRWCAEKAIDPDCEPFFNPAASVPRPSARQYEGVALLSRGEIEALLAVLQADRSPLGLREYAFFLARLRLGVPLQHLQRLTWGQLQLEGSGAWVRWRSDAEPVLLPCEVWDAIFAYLVGAGRLDSMQLETYIFAPLVHPTAPQSGLGPGDWAGDRYLSTQQLRANLKRYGRVAGIPENKLQQHALRRTATRLRLDSDDTLERVQAFLDSRSAPRLADYRLSLLPPLPDDPDGHAVPSEIEVPNRQPRRFETGEVYVHGFYARSQPPEEIQAVLAEDIQGLDEQICGLRALGRGLLERKLGIADPSGVASLLDLYGQVTGWLAILVQTEDQLGDRGKEGSWADEFLDALVDLELERSPAIQGSSCAGSEDQVDAASAEPEVPEQEIFSPSLQGRGRGRGQIGDKTQEAAEIRQAFIAEAMGSDPGLALDSRRLVEEIATLRYVLRNTLVVAAASRDSQEYARMVQHYGRGCMRLARLLRRQKSDWSRLAAYLNKAIDQAVDEITADWAK